MMNYYELDEDLYIDGRWVLDDPIDDTQRDGREFRYGQPLTLRGPLIAPLHTRGIALDFSFTLSDIPVLSPRFANAIRGLVHEQAQLFRVQIDGYQDFEVLNPVCKVDCFDESRSEFLAWKQEDGRPDKMGEYRMVTRLRLDPGKIPSKLHVFRVMGWKIALIVSQAFVDAIRPLNPTGPKLELVT